MAALASFYRFILPEVPTCSFPQLDFHLRETARTFCVRTGVWRGAFDPVDSIAGQATYDLFTPESQSEAIRITSLAVNGVNLWTDAESSDDEYTESPKYPRAVLPFVLSVDLKSITLVPSEVPSSSVSAGLQVSGVMRPSVNAQYLPDFLLDRFSDAMRFGTLSRLFRLGNVPWTDRQLAVDYSKEFDRLSNLASFQGAVGNTRKALRVRKWG